MNNQLILNHNNIVDVNDMVYHIGDFAVKGLPFSHERILSLLNGRHFLIRGNHDRSGKKTYLNAGFIGITKQTYVAGFRLQHKPDYMSNDWHLSGHGHNTYTIRNHAINVGVDVNDFKPLSLTQIKEIVNIMEEKTNYENA